MKLKKLLERSEYEIVSGSGDRDIASVVYDSRKAEDGSLFVCIVGANSDGHAYIDDVLEKGASCVVIQKDHIEKVKGAFEGRDATLVAADDTRTALALISAAWFGYPAERLPVIGITGTKGKTTTTYMIKSILDNSGIKTGLIGTIECYDGKENIPSKNTTPESYLIQEYLSRMIENGCKACVMEVSSQALMLDRTAGIMFEIGVFTNIEPDHIGENEHKDFDDYLHCKSLLFRQCRLGIFNNDDEKVDDILKGHTCEVETYSIDNRSDLRAVNIEHVKREGSLGIAYDIENMPGLRVELEIPGKFSVYNSLCAIAVCRHFDVPQDIMKEALLKARVKGRIEIVDTGKPYTLMIDYAHNAMALESLLTTLKDYEPERIVCLFGCGGNRDKSRRYEMGEVSGKLADLTVITSDNPRFEEPQAIIDDIKIGMAKTDGKYVEICDRREAIAYVMENGRPGDIIILAGKGHEDYQEIRGKKYPMDERDIIADILNKGNNG